MVLLQIFVFFTADSQQGQPRNTTALHFIEFGEKPESKLIYCRWLIECVALAGWMAFRFARRNTLTGVG